MPFLDASHRFDTKLDISVYDYSVGEDDDDGPTLGEVQAAEAAAKAK